MFNALKDFIRKDFETATGEDLFIFVFIAMVALYTIGLFVLADFVLTMTTPFIQ